MSILTGLFNIFALIYIVRAVQLTIQIVRDWSEVRSEPLTRAKQRLAEQAAFFISVPISVFIHELFHALAVWLFGGQVVEFAYRVFWGYVVPAGEFTLTQTWFIALAGTLGSLLFGLSAWFLLRRQESRSLQYFGLRTFRFQIYFSLLYYPLMTLVLPIGDWRMIYDVSATPVLSVATAAVHILLLALFWRADRRGWFEMPAFESTDEQTLYEQQVSAAALNDPQATLRTIDQLRRGGATRQARVLLDQFLSENPASGQGYLLKVTLLDAGRAQIGRDAVENAEKALELGLANPDQTAFAQQLVASYFLQNGDGRQAEAWLTRAMSTGPSQDQLAHLHYLRSQAHRRLGNLDAARRDILQALQLAEATGDAGALAQYRQELAVVDKHRGPRVDEGEVSEFPAASPTRSE